MPNYYTIDEAKAAGITEAQLDDTELALQISYWEDFIEDITSKKFYSRSETVEVDGTGHAMVKLDHNLAPMTAVTSVSVDDNEIDNDFYTFYQDVPCIVFTDKVYRNIFAGLTSTFPSDRNNVKVVGTFGPASVPKAIKMLMELILKKVASGEMDDRMKSEKIGDYSYQKFMEEGGFFDTQMNMYLNALTMKMDIEII